jgi:hypothetical protein
MIEFQCFSIFKIRLHRIKFFEELHNPKKLILNL